MRGRNIIWLSLIAVLLGAMTVNLGVSAAPVNLYLTPDQIPGPGLSGNVGDEYTVSVNVDDVNDLWGVGFEIHYAPYVSVLTISQIYEGPFLGEGWDPYEGMAPGTDFSYTVDLFSGIAYIAIVRLPYPDPEIPREGANGAGVVATFKLTVIEAGECPVEMKNSYLLDSMGDPIAHKATSSFYQGSTAMFVRTEVLPGKLVNVGETMLWYTKVKNTGTSPLYVRVRFDISRLEDARKIVLRTGETYLDGGVGVEPPTWIDYLYVNAFTGHYGEGWGWYYVGAEPYLNAVGDGNYIWSDWSESDLPGHYPYTGRYDFDDFTLDPERVIDSVVIEAYTQYPAADENMDLDTYMRTPYTEAPPSQWLGSLWGTGTPGWHTVRWTTNTVTDIFPEMAGDDPYYLNGARVRFMLYWTADDGPHGEVQVDAMRLKVTTIPAEWGVIPADPAYVELPPLANLELGVVTWVPKLSHVGTYEVTATVEYTSEFLKWNSWGSKQKTFTIKILP